MFFLAPISGGISNAGGWRIARAPVKAAALDPSGAGASIVIPACDHVAGGWIARADSDSLINPLCRAKAAAFLSQITF